MGNRERGEKEGERERGEREEGERERERHTHTDRQTETEFVQLIVCFSRCRFPFDFLSFLRKSESESLDKGGDSITRSFFQVKKEEKRNKKQTNEKKTTSLYQMI